MHALLNTITKETVRHIRNKISDIIGEVYVRCIDEKSNLLIK